MQEKDKKIWKYVTGKINNTYGETDLDRHIIKINKQYHKSKGDHPDGVPVGEARLGERRIERERLLERGARIGQTILACQRETERAP